MWQCGFVHCPTESEALLLRLPQPQLKISNFFLSSTRLKRTATMYESSCSYQTALDLKRGVSPLPQVKTEDCLGLTAGCSADWASYRLHQSTFEQLKQSVEKAKAALQDRTCFLGGSSVFR